MTDHTLTKRQMAETIFKTLFNVDSISNHDMEFQVQRFLKLNKVYLADHYKRALKAIESKAV